MDGDRVGSERLHKVVVRLTREDEVLHFDFTGSSPQVDAAVNCTYHGTVAGAAVPIYTFLCQGDIDWNDGVKRCIKVTAPAGTVVNASFPAPVSICTIGFRWLVTVAASQAVAKMLDASVEFRDRVCSSWSVSANCNNLFGVTADGKRVGALLSDHRGGGAAARSFADGFSHSGQTTSFSASMANVESQEWKLPIALSLPPAIAGYRRRRALARRTDGGGSADPARRARADPQIDQYGRHASVQRSRDRRRLSGRRLAGARAPRHGRVEEAKSRPDSA